MPYGEHSAGWRSRKGAIGIRLITDGNPQRLTLAYGNATTAKKWPFNITIINVNEAPTRTWATTPVVVEHALKGTLVSEIYSDDPDYPFDTIRYTLMSLSG